MSSALQRAQAFGQSPEVQTALAGGDPKYASSVFYRAQTETDPAAKQYLMGLADQLRAKNIAPEIAGTTQDWKGKSHNFFAQHPWLAPVAAAVIPGVGPLVGAAIGAGTQALSGVGSAYKPTLGSVLKGGAFGAAGGLANTALLGGKGISGLSGLGASAGSGVKGLIGKLGAGIVKNPLQAAELGLAGLSTVQGIRQQNRAQDLQQQALNRTQQDYQSRSPLRDALLAGALQLPTTLPGSQMPQLPAYQSANPFARRGQ